jgi:hypothetical protein
MIHLEERVRDLRAKLEKKLSKLKEEQEVTGDQLTLMKAK